MMGPRQVAQGSLFYEFNLDVLVPQDHLLRSIDRFVDLSGVRAHLAPFFCSTGRPSVEPELMIRMLIIGFTHGIRSERRLCEVVRLNLASRWFCRLDLTDPDPRSLHLFQEPSRALSRQRSLSEGFRGRRRPVHRCRRGRRRAFRCRCQPYPADANKLNSTAKEDWDPRRDQSRRSRARAPWLTICSPSMTRPSVPPPTSRRSSSSHSDPSSWWSEEEQKTIQWSVS